MESNRNKQLLGLRPSLHRVDHQASTNPSEQFQNETLRPILKLQNEVLLLVFRQYFHKRKGAFYELSMSKKKTYIEQAVQKDNRFRSLLSGLVIGHFTADEFKKYESNESELNRRISTLVIKRIQDQIRVF